MNVNDITTAISSIGFPIVCCIVMFKYLEKERESHKAEIDNMTSALNENTKVLIELRHLIENLTKRTQDHDA